MRLGQWPSFCASVIQILSVGFAREPQQSTAMMMVAHGMLVDLNPLRTLILC